MKVTLPCMCVCVMVVVCVTVTTAVPTPQDQKDGGWVVKTDQSRDGGTRVQAEANKKWDISKDGKVQAEVHGHWDRTYGGPNKGQRDHGVGGSIGGSWGK